MSLAPRRLVPRCLVLYVGMVCWAALAPGAEPNQPLGSGWRGNVTGVWNQANPPLEWSHVPHGAMEGLRSQSGKPAGDDASDAPLVHKGLPRDWLVAGPFTLADAVRDFDEPLVPREAELNPADGEQLGDRVWTALSVPRDDRFVFGTAELPWIDLGAKFGAELNQAAYAHTYLHSPRGGKVRLVIDHSFGCKIWVNGQVVYRSPTRRMVLGYYTQLSRLELDHNDAQSGACEFTLRPGWNRCLVRLTMSPKADWRELRCSLRLGDSADVPYETKNIRWMTELPGRSTSTPILVGDRIYLTAEPDELVAIDKQSGRMVWTAAINEYEALTPEEKSANPEFAARIDPLVARLRAEPDRRRRVALRRELAEALKQLDPKRFTPDLDGHFASHFGIVGYTMPTPVTDGQSIYVLNGKGVAASYDLDGRRRWITRLDVGPLTYGSSPGLAGGVLGCFLNRLYGLDSATGQLRWTQPRIQRNVAAILGATLGDQPVFVTQRGDVVRASDGKLLFRPRGMGTGDEGWSPPVVADQHVFLPRFGVTNLYHFDFSQCSGDDWQPVLREQYQLPDTISRREGKWIDRWTAGSPLIWNNHVYQTDIYQELYVLDMASKKMVDRQELPLDGFTHYCAVAVAASPTLVANKLLVLDNQGTTLVLEPGPPAKVIHTNRIGTQLARDMPIPFQETLAYAPPIADGDRLYLRGERFLYCIGR